MSEPMKPMEIEQRSFEIITELLGNRVLDPENELVIKRVIHTTADFDYADNLTFSEHAVQKGIAALKSGCDIVTDTQMAKAGSTPTRSGPRRALKTATTPAAFTKSSRATSSRAARRAFACFPPSTRTRRSF